MTIARGLLAALAVLLVLSPATANAVTLFGTVEDIHPIQDVRLTGPDGQALFLGNKTSTVYFIGGAALSDDGYVLGLRAEPNRFLDMPAGGVLADFQKRGLLPDPLPGYRLGFLAYLKGYSLWIALAVALGTYALVLLGRRRAGRRRY